MSNLTKLLFVRDIDRINQGLELLWALGDAAIHSYFLKGCVIDKEGGLARNKKFFGSAGHGGKAKALVT